MAVGDLDKYSSIAFWDRLIHSGPAHALVEIDELLARGDLHGESVALAHGATGRCLFESGRLFDASVAARRALASSASCSREVRTWIAMGASIVLAETGQIDEALASLEELATETSGVALGRVRAQIAYVLQHAGRLNEALAEIDVSERLFARGGEDGDRFRVHQNRGLVLLQLGRLPAAEADFIAAESIASEMGMTSARAQAVANRAVLLGRARRLSEAIEQFDRAERLFAEAGNPLRPVGIMSIDRAEVLMHSGLPADAVEAGKVAIGSVEPSGNAMMLGDALLVTARAELAAGRHRRAMTTAGRAEETFASSERTDMAPHAQAIVVHAGLESATDVEGVAALLDDAARVASTLRAAGWTAHADDLASARIRAGHRWGLGAAVRADINRLRVGAMDGRRDTALSGWWAEAMGRAIDQDASGAIEACHGGLSVLDDIVTEAPTLEARSAAMKIGSDLSQLLIELAVDIGDADTVLAAAEGTRARALHDELLERERHRPLTEEGATGLRVELAARLGERTLVEWIVARDRVWAVVFNSTGSRLVEIGDRQAVLRARDRVLMWLDLAAAEPDERSGRAMDAARRLDDLLIGPLDLPPVAGVALVPTDLLHGIPWSGLPSFAGRPISLTPNAQVWLEADRRTGRRIASAGLVLGPGVYGADVERRAFERAHPAGVSASEDGATAAAVRSMFAAADLVHVAAHGTFRSDHPLLSTLRLFDGDATLFDAIPDRVESLLVVMSSCEGGAQGTADGSEVLGLSAVLLARGAAAVLAPLTVVRELECADFVAEVHDELAAGEPFACAVAAVRQRWLAADDLSQWAVASSFSCFGSGAVTLAD